MDGFESRLRARMKKISEKIRASIKATLDDTVAKKQAALLKKQLDKTLKLSKIETKVSARSMAQTRKSLQSLPGVEEAMSADVVANAKTLAATTTLSAWRMRQRARLISLTVRISKGSLAAAAGQIKALTGMAALTEEFQKFTNGIKNFFTTLPGIARATAKFASFGAVVVHFIGAALISIASLGPAVQGLGAAALAIPGIIAGFAASMAVVITSLKNAPEIVKAAGREFQGLKEIVTSNFWAVAEASTASFLSQLARQVKAGMGDLSKAVGGVVNQLATSMREVFTDDVTAGLFANITAGAKALQPAMIPLAGILKNLLIFGTSLLPGISVWLTKVAGQFDAWLATAVETGALNDMLGDLGDFLQAAWSGAKGLVGIIGGLANAAANAGIGGLFTGLEDIAAIVNSPAFQSTLTLFFEGVAEGSRGVLSALGPIGDMFTVLMPLLSTFIGEIGTTVGDLFSGMAVAMSSPVFQEGLSAFFEGILGFIRPLLPVLPQLVGKFADLGALAGKILDQLGPVFATAIEALLPVFGDLIDAFGPLVDTLGPALMKIIEALAPVFAALIPALMPIMDLIVALVPPVAELITKLVEGLAPIFEMLAPILMDLVAAIMPVVMQLFDILMPLIGPLMGILMLLIKVALDPLIMAMKVIAFVVGLVGPTLEILAIIIGAVFETIVALFNGDTDKIGEIWTDAWDAIVDTVMDFAAKIWEFFGDFFLETMGMFKDFFTNTVGMVVDFWNNTIGMFEDFGDNLAAGWDTIWTNIENLVRDVWNNVIGFIEGGVNGALDLINGMISGFNDIQSALPGGGITIPLIPTVSLPRLAMGATVLPSAGGTAAILGEGGRAESIVDTGMMNKLLRQVLQDFPRQVRAMQTGIQSGGGAGAGSTAGAREIHNHFPLPRGADPAEIAQEFVNRAAEKAGI